MRKYFHKAIIICSLHAENESVEGDGHYKVNGTTSGEALNSQETWQEQKE